MLLNSTAIEERMRRKTDRSQGVDGCWIWMGSRIPSGYGKITLAKRQRYAHRVAYELNHGPIPNGLFVCHMCDDPSCVNPAHLFLGTHAENMADMKAKSKTRRRRRLVTKDQVLLAISLSSLGWTIEQIADELDLGWRTVQNVLRQDIGLDSSDRIGGGR